MNITWIGALMALSFLLISTAEAATHCGKNDSLFRIERSKNKNIVQYDACLLKNNDVSDSNPIHAYWVLANGKNEELSAIESRQAYGIESKEKLGKNEYRVSLAALKDRDITVKQIKGDYKALVKINGESSILQKVYVNSEEQTLGLPKVHYVEIFGRSIKTNKPVEERITPK